MPPTSNGTIDALCPNCSTIKKLMPCFHCMQPLCTDCIDLHVDFWKDTSLKYLDQIEKKTEKYLTKINTLNPLFVENKVNVEKVKGEIEESFQTFIAELNNQKLDLFRKLDEIESENEQFKSFELEILQLKDETNRLQETLKTNDKEELISQFDTVHAFKDQVQQTSESYSKLKNKNFKIIGEFEKPPNAAELNFFGNLIINESELLKSSKQPDKNSVSKGSVEERRRDPNDRTHMFGTLRVKLRRLAEQMSELQTTIKLPILEFDINIEPKYLASYHKNVFIADRHGNLCVAELSDNGLDVKSMLRLYISNVGGICANKKYLAVGFSNLSNEQLAVASRYYKKLEQKAGVLVFKFADNHSSLVFEKVISSSKNYNLISPCGLAVYDNFLFVCDRELHAVFKIDIKSGSLHHRLITTDQEPVSICMGEKHFAYTDALKLEIHMLDADKFIFNKSVKFSDELFAEPFDVTLKEGSNLFVKNQADLKIMVYDSNMNIKYSFDYDGSQGLGIHSLKVKPDYLLVGCKQDITSGGTLTYKLGLFSDF